MREGWFVTTGMYSSVQSVSPGLTTRIQALEHYEDIADIKRAIVHTTGLQPDVCLFLLVLSRMQTEVFVVACQLL